MSFANDATRGVLRSDPMSAAHSAPILTSFGEDQLPHCLVLPTGMRGNSQQLREALD